MARYPALWRFSLTMCMLLCFAAARPCVCVADDNTDPNQVDIAPPDAATASETPDATATDPMTADATATDPVATAPATTADSSATEVIQERYPNRTIKIERTVTQDSEGNYVNHGPWKMFDEKGTPVAEGQFQQGQRQGVWNRWYRNREVDLIGTNPYVTYTAPFISQAVFKDGKLHGKWTIYDSKQRKISEIEFADGQRNGRAIWWYMTGKKMRDVNYKDGVVDGEFIEWSPENKVVINDTYKAGRKIAPKIDYYGGTQKKSEGTYLFAKDLVKTPDDWWTAHLATYAKEGKDEKHGPSNSWYPTGQLKMQATYENDVPVGHFTWWYSNGQKALEGAYQVGKPNGKWTWWHQNGQKSAQGLYASGHPTGPWSWWRDDGKVAQAADFTEGNSQSARLPDTTPEVLLEKLK